jgi:hypothetical protein
MMNRAEQTWPDDEVIEVESEQYDGRIIDELIAIVDSAVESTKETR